MNTPTLSTLILAEVHEIVRGLHICFLTAELWLRKNWLRLLCFLLKG